MPTPNVDVIPSQMKYFRDQIHVGETIARGGSSFVYRGVLLPRNLPIAIKHLFSNGHGVVDRCKREVAMLMGLAHDHVVTVLGYCELSEKEVYVLLELSNEGSLQTRITSVPRVAVEMPQAIRWCLQIVNALQYLCAMNVLHLDLKLANILLFGTNVKLCDFSASKFVDPQRLETQGTRSYTVEYASPEVLNSDNQVFPETDLYGLGCIICELVTGMPPWGDDKEPTIRRKVHEGESPNVMDHPWPLDCPVEVRQLAQQLLSYDPSARSSLAEANAILWAATKPRVPEVLLFTTKCSLPKGWITSLTPLPLSAALSELANVVIPAGRPDLERHKKRATLTSLPALYLKIASLCRDGKLRHNLTPTSDQQSVYDAATGAATGASVITFDEDMHAIALYTAESPVCYLINGTLSHLTCTVQDTLRHTAPLIQCIYGAIRRLGSVFRGCAFRVVYGDTPLMRSAFDHHTSHFRAGQEVNMHQFVSFTKSPSYIQHFTANTTRPMILFKCEDLVGYDINNFSCCVLSNRPSEEEVIVLPPAYFVVKGTSFKVNNMVTVELTYCQAKAAAHTFWEAQQHDARAETPANDADVPAATASEASQPTPLVIAISAGNAQLVRSLAEMGASVIAQDEHGVAPLHIAARNGRADVIRALVDLGADVSVVNDINATPLFVAAQAGHVAAVRALAELGCSVTQGINGGMTPFLMAANEGHVDVVRALVSEFRVDVSESLVDDGVQAVHMAASAGYAHMMVLLVELGADISARTLSGCTPLQVAATSGRWNVVQTLVGELGVSQTATDSGEPSPIFHAALQGNVDMVHFLGKHGGDPNECAPDGATALHVAAQEGFVDVINALVTSFGATVDALMHDGSTPLFIAAKGGHAEAVAALAELGANANYSMESGLTPAVIAAFLGHATVVSVLAALKVDLAAEVADGLSPALAAAQNGFLEVLHVLVACGVDVFRPSSGNGATVMYLAAQVGHAELINGLAKLGGNVAAPSTADGATPLFIAAQEGHANVVSLLADLGADVDAPMEDGTTPLMIAVLSGHEDVVKELLLHGADVNLCNPTDAVTPMIAAAERGDADDVIKMLASYGADLNAESRDGKTPLINAALQGHLSNVVTLLDLNAAVNKPSSQNGATALYVAAQEGHVEVVLLLAECGADVHATMHDGGMPLLIASVGGHVDVIRALVKHGADVSRGNSLNGATAVFIAAQNGHVDAINVLAQLNADVSFPNEHGMTPVYIAASNGKTDAVRALARLGANVLTAMSDGSTPLFAAAMHGHVETIRALVELRADVHTATTRGCTPAQVAAQEGHADVLRLLAELGG